MNTSVSALLDECAGYGEGESEIPEEDEFFAEDNTKGIMILWLLLLFILMLKNFCSNYTKIKQRFLFDQFLMLTGQCMVNVREAIKIVAWSTVEKFNFVVIQSSNAPLISWLYLFMYLLKLSLE